MSVSFNRFPVKTASSPEKMDVFLPEPPSYRQATALEAAFGIPRDLTAQDLLASFINEGIISETTEGHPARSTRLHQIYKGMDMAFAMTSVLFKELNEREQPLLLVPGSTNTAGFQYAAQNFLPKIEALEVDLVAVSELSSVSMSRTRSPRAILTNKDFTTPEGTTAVIQVDGKNTVIDEFGGEAAFKHPYVGAHEHFFRVSLGQQHNTN